MATTSELLDMAVRSHQNGDLRQAETLYRQVLRVNPHHIQALHNLGVTLKGQGLLAEAALCYREALLLDPANSAAHYNLGNILREQGSWAEAALSYQHALAGNPHHADAHNNLGIVFKNQGQLAEAILCYRQALRLNPQHAEAHNNLGNALEDQGDVVLAVDCYRRALQLNPDHAETHHNLSVAVSRLGLHHEALEQNERALRIKPAHAPARWQRSLLRLLHGNFEGGWQDYEQRWALSEIAPRSFQQPRWEGSSLEGKSILVFAEQGLGDTIQFVRYLPMVKDRGGTVLFECQPALASLCTRMRGIDQLIVRGAPLPAFDAQIPLLSLPGIFATTLATIPTAVPYLRADPKLVADWRREFEAIEGFKVGIAWQGSPTNKGDRYRSIPLTLFESLTSVSGARVLSLQVGPGTEQLAAVPFPTIDVGSRFDPSSLEDLAAVLMNLDLVVTIESAVAHLAGAMALPVWVALPIASDWRWLLERADSPWYHTMRLFRQRRFGDWSEVLEHVNDELKLKIAERGRHNE
jgi:Tfp pilus assembly protein PilF